MTEVRRELPPLRRVLPVVVDMCSRIDDVFVQYVGPVADEIAAEIYEYWLKLGNTGPSGVRMYIHLLAQNIVDDNQRVSFGDEAHTAMRQALERHS